MSVSLLFAVGLAAAPSTNELTANETAAIEAGTLVSRRWLDEGVLHGRVGGRVERPVAWVHERLRRGCFGVRPAQLIDERFFSADEVEGRGAPLAMAAWSRDDIEGFAAVDCAALATPRRFYSYAVYDSPGFFPDAWSLVRYVVEPGATGGWVIETEQVAGSTKAASSRIEIAARGADAAVVTAAVRFELGIPMPDPLLRLMIDVEAEAPRAAQLRKLRAAAATAPPSATPTTAPPSSSPAPAPSPSDP